MAVDDTSPLQRARQGRPAGTSDIVSKWRTVKRWSRGERPFEARLCSLVVASATAIMMAWRPLSVSQNDQTHAEYEHGHLMGSAAYGRSLPSTITTIIQQAQDGDEASKGRFYCRYATPTYCYFRKLGSDHETAKDLTQNTMMKLLAEEALTGFRPTEGRFRSYLKRALANLFVDHWRREHAARRYPEGGLADLDPILEEVGERWSPADDLTPEEEFDCRYVYGLLDVAVDRVEDDCKAEGLTVHFAIFTEMYLKEYEDRHRPSWNQIGQAHGLSDDQARQKVRTVLNRVRTALRDELRAGGVADPEIDGEVTELIRAFGRRSSRVF